MPRRRRTETHATVAAQLTEARSDVTAVTRVLSALDGASTTEAVVHAALDTVRDCFGWAYGSYWAVDHADGILHFLAESGDAGSEFRAVTRTASFAEGVGLS